MSKKEWKIHGEDSGGSSGHEGVKLDGREACRYVFFSGSLKTHYIPQPENQLLKEADEADSGASPAF